MICMEDDKIFLDTNIIIYAYDVTARDKHSIAREILIELWGSGRGVLSTQVLQEFFINVVGKIPKPIDRTLAGNIIKDLLKWNVVVNDGESILGAIEILMRYSFSFWDSLIIEAALKGGAETLLSEDLSDGQVIDGITIINPFQRKF